MITTYFNQYQIKRTWDIILVLSSQRLPMHRALGMLWSVGLDCFGFPSVLKDQSLTTRRAFAMVFLSPWSLEQRKYYWQPLEEMSAGMNLNLKRFCQGESDRNVIFYAWNIYKFQDALRQRRWATRRPMNFTKFLQSFIKFVQKVCFAFGKKDQKNTQYLWKENYRNKCAYV